MKLRDYLHSLNAKGITEDVCVDGSECEIAICGGDIKLTPFALDYFKEALDLPFDAKNNLIESDNDKDYDDYDDYGTGVLALAEKLIVSLAGYYSSDLYDKYFKGEDAKLI